jgi:hypothetical protein
LGPAELRPIAIPKSKTLRSGSDMGSCGRGSRRYSIADIMPTIRCVCTLSTLSPCASEISPLYLKHLRPCASFVE